jgi:hypothetical protein
MIHRHDRTYSFTDLRSYCLANGFADEAERLGLYLALQREQGAAEDLAAYFAPLDPSFLALPAYA